MHPHCPPEIFLAVQREQVFAATPAEEAHIRSRMRHMLGTQSPEQIDRARQLMSALNMHRECPRRACRRGGACRTRLVTCLWENLDVLQKEVFPAIRRVAGEI